MKQKHEYQIGDIVRIKGTDKYGVIRNLSNDPSAWGEGGKAQIEWITEPYNLITKNPTAYHLTIYLEKIE